MIILGATFKLFILCPNSKAVKLASLFAQYLYAHHRLDLPGIGTFLLDPSVIATLENSKQRSLYAEGISFQNNPAVKESPDLIAFISAQTGKMKALAYADLDSYLQLAQQFLNIGKPFTFEGIGTLVKKRPGEYEFTPLSLSAEKVKEFKVKEPAPVVAEEAPAEYDSISATPQSGSGWKKTVFALLILTVIGAAGWGIYTMSKNKATVEGATNTVVGAEDTPPANNTAQTATELPKAPADHYKYILEVADSGRALKRYTQLKEYKWDVQLETRDSVSYKLFLLLPALNADTTRIMDSLRIMTGRRVYIEHQN